MSQTSGVNAKFLGGGGRGMPRDTRFVVEEKVLVKFLVNSRSEQLQNFINISRGRATGLKIIKVVLKGIGEI